MDGGELVGCPYSEHNEKDEARKIDGATSAQTGMAADVDHRYVSEPHRKGEKYLRIAEVARAHRRLCDERSDKQTCCHAGEAKE